MKKTVIFKVSFTDDSNEEIIGYFKTEASAKRMIKKMMNIMIRNYTIKGILLNE